MLETGDIIKAGQVFEVAGMSCRCRGKRWPNWDIARCTMNRRLTRNNVKNPGLASYDNSGSTSGAKQLTGIGTVKESVQADRNILHGLNRHILHLI